MIWHVHDRTGGAFTVREQVDPEDEPGLVALFQACEEWFVEAHGLPSGPGDVQSLFYSLPEGTEPDDKRLFVVQDDSGIVGLVDVVTRHPLADACTVGLFLIHPDVRRRGLGTAVTRELCNEARMAGVTRIVASGTEGIPSSDAFLRSLGFEVFDEPVQYRSDNRVIHAGERPVHRAVLDLRE